jgi:hypothetical protein
MFRKEPIVGSIPDVTAVQNAASDITIFTVSDTATPAGNLIVTAVNSSNPLLAPVANVQFGGSGGTRLMIVIPSRDQVGMATITVRVTNAAKVWSERTFNLTVLPTPAPVRTSHLSVLKTHRKEPADAVVTTSDAERRVVIEKNKPTPIIPLIVEHFHPDWVTITFETLNPGLIPAGNIFFGGSGKTRTVFILPAPDQTGESRVTINAKDIRGRKATTTFLLTVCETVEPGLAIPEIKIDFGNSGPTVLISYASEDAVEARKLYSKLAEDDLTPWMDKIDIDAGEDWDRRIRSAIKRSDFVIVCVSHTILNKRGYIQKEIKLVLDRVSEIPPDDIFLIPLRLEDCVVPEELSKYHYVDWFSDDGYERLVRSIRKEFQKI